MIRRVGGETVVVICFVIMTVFYFYESFNLQRTMMSDIVGPTLFPRLVAGLALILSAIYFFQLARKESGGGESKTLGEHVGDLLPVLPIIVYVLLLEPIGFLFSTAIYVFLAMLLYGRPLMRAVLAAFVMSITFFALFYFGLLAQVPLGWFIHTERVLPFLIPIRRAMGA